MRTLAGFLSVLVASSAFAASTDKTGIDGLVKSIIIKKSGPDIESVTRTLHLDPSARTVENSAVLEGVSYIHFPGLISKEGYKIDSVTFRLVHGELSSFALEIEPQPCLRLEEFQNKHGRLQPGGAVVDTTLRAYERAVADGKIYIYTPSPGVTGGMCIVTLGYQASGK